jgi:S-adenosylmethionine:tRNA ribosyltransferase-isomerase
VRVDLLDYHLPPERIAHVPAARREDARLLVLDRATGALTHGVVGDLVAHLDPGDLLVVNDTRVVPARLSARRTTGGRADLLLLEPAGPPEGAWSALVRCGGSLRPGEVLLLEGAPILRLVHDQGGGRWRVTGTTGDLAALMARHGRMPLPPYIPREAADTHDALDRERYQTVYAAHDGAVAAPTAGLHLGRDLLRALEARGIGREAVTLHVGLGTFEPVRAEDLDAHAMHEEAWRLPAATAQAVRAVRASARRVVAVGTTSVRALETAAAASSDGLPAAASGRTRLLIQPGHAFRAVDALLTNFHLPRSTLLALVAAFAGRERVLAAYAEAVAEGYRFYSYGDAMLIL